MLHECGHILAGGRKAIAALVDAPARKKRTLSYRVSFAVNESRAWDAGERLATRLRIPYDKDAYEKYRALYLGKHFGLAARKKTGLKYT